MGTVLSIVIPGYTGDSLAMKIIMALMLGLGIYNALELIVIIFVTFNKYRGMYFWSLIIATIGVMGHNFGFVVKFFQLLDPNKSEGFVAVVVLVLGWFAMITGCHFRLVPHSLLTDIQASRLSYGRGFTSLRTLAEF